MPYGEVMLSRHGLYPATGGALLPELGGRSELDLILWLLFYCDGRGDIDTIAGQLGIASGALDALAARLAAAGVLERV
jgi:aminopeptidase-like protein